MKYFSSFCVIFFLFMGCDLSRRGLKERDYQNDWCLSRGGKVEVVLKEDGIRYRCDCVVDGYAIEFDWAGKWEAVEQALHYARVAGFKAGIVFICRKARDKKKIARTRKNVEFYQLPIKIWSINCE